MTGFAFNLVLETRRNVRDIAAWLERNCAGRWGVRTVSERSGHRCRNLQIMFDEETDRTRFESAFSGEVWAAAE